MARPPFLGPDGKVTQEWRDTYKFRVEHPEFGVHEYVPTIKGLEFHESPFLWTLIEGSRGTGKSMIIRNDAHMRAMSYPGYTYLIVRRTMPELKKSHLKPGMIDAEMRKLGGYFHKTDNIAHYPNGSTGFFSHCETEDDMLKLLSSEYCAVYFDEISTFTWVMVTKIASCVRVPEGSGLLGVVRAGTNPIGVGAAEVRSHFITKDVAPEDDPDYDPADYHNIHTTLDDNPFIDRAQYIKQLSKLPEHIRRAWLDGEWILEGMYFHDFRASWKVKGDDESLLRRYKLGQAIGWHVIEETPTVSNRLREHHSWEQPKNWFSWIQIYRAIDWGFSPDPAVCLWIAVLPNGRAFVFKEKTWRATPARIVAREIVAASAGMRVAETYCDPTMFYNDQATELKSIGDIFEENGVPLTPAVNDRVAAGFAIHEYLSTLLDDDLPKIQIYAYGCPWLIKTIPEMRTHKTDPRKIADGNDHWVIALAYFCMGAVGTSRESHEAATPRWMRKKPKAKHRLGSESVRGSNYRRFGNA